MNEATVKITGVKREIDLISLTTLHNQIWQEVYEEVFQNGFVIDSPLTLCHKDGKLTDVFNGSVYKMMKVKY
jgi:hypothetical protein